MSDLFPVIVALPGRIFSSASQDLRDRVNDWLAGHQVPDGDVESYYFVWSDEHESSAFGARAHVNSATHICFGFQDARVATLFKLTFG